MLWEKLYFKHIHKYIQDLKFNLLIFMLIIKKTYAINVLIIVQLILVYIVKNDYYKVIKI